VVIPGVVIPGVVTAASRHTQLERHVT